MDNNYFLTNIKYTPDQTEFIKKYKDLNVYKILALYPLQIRDAWMNFLQGLYEMNFDPKIRELVILRYAFNTQTLYEMVNHIELSKNAGFTNGEIIIILTEKNVISLDDKYNFFCKIVDEFENNKGRLSDDVYNILKTTYDVDFMIKLFALLGHISCLARTINVVNLPLEKHSVSFENGKAY